MSKQPSIKSQIAAIESAVAGQEIESARRLIEAILERRLSKEDRAAVEAMLAELPAGYNMSSHIAKYRARYQRSVAASGAKSLNNGDAVAEALEYKTALEVMKLADDLLGAPKGFSSHAERYERLNEGQKRMNSGNKLRAAVKRGDLIVEDGRFLAA